MRMKTATRHPLAGQAYPARPPSAAASRPPRQAQRPAALSSTYAAAADDWIIAGKTVVITGATNGIGRAAAEQLAAQGATVVLACRNLAAAQQAAREIQAAHPGSSVVVGPQLDLASQDSVRRFAEEYRAQGWPLHVLINNAGANHHGKPWFTAEGVNGQGQVNFLGPFTLTRLLEQELQRSAPSRVVNLSSVTHRYAHVGSDISQYLTKWRGYPSTKLANALFAFELQRRLGHAGVSSCAVDPGGVASNIWSSAELSSRGPVAFVIQSLYAPPSDGAAAVVHAATAPWSLDAAAATAVNRAWAAPEERPPASSSSSSSSSSSATPELRFYARGLFATPLVTSWRGVPNRRSLVDSIRGALWGLATLLCSLADYPLRNLSGGRLASKTTPVPAAPLVYSPAVAAELWDVACDAAGLPRDPVIVQQQQ